MNEETHEFYLKINPLKDTTIPLGLYKLKNAAENIHLYRIGHPIAQLIIQECKENELPQCNVFFKYTGIPKVSILEPYIGQCGWLSVINLEIDSFENENHIILAGVSDSGEKLSIDICKRLFSLHADVGEEQSLDDTTKQRIVELIHAAKIKIIDDISQRNATFFETEMEKLDNWAEDRKQSLEMRLKELEKDIKTQKTEARKFLKLDEKVKAQRQIKEMENKRREMRQDLYQAQDKVDERKEALLTQIEMRMEQKVTVTNVFTIRWSLVLNK